MATFEPEPPRPLPPIDPSRAPTMAQLKALSVEELEALADYHAVSGPTVNYAFWTSELVRRIEVRLAEQLLAATAELSRHSAATASTTAGVAALLEASGKQSETMRSLTGSLAEMTKTITRWTRVSGVIAACALLIAAISLVVALS